MAIELSTQNEEFAKAALTGSERSLFNKQFKELFYPPWSTEKQYINSQKGFLMDAIAVAKNAHDEKTFGGFNCQQNELGITPIRPGHVGLAGTGAAEADNVWQWNSTTAAPANDTGFDGWIHSPDTGADTTAFTVNEDSTIIPMYIAEEEASPKIQTLKIDVGRTDVLYYDTRAAVIRDEQHNISLIPLPKMIWGPRQDVKVDLQTKVSGTIEPRLGGFTVALGSFLDATTYDKDGNTVTTKTVTST